MMKQPAPGSERWREIHEGVCEIKHDPQLAAFWRVAQFFVLFKVDLPRARSLVFTRVVNSAQLSRKKP